MEKIYVRLLALVDAFADGSQTALAKKAGLNQSTFWGYLSKDGQSKIKLHTLERILAAFPQVNRDWLYFGEGEMAARPEQQQMPQPVNHNLLTKAIRMLEEALDTAGGRLEPELKAEAVVELYAMLLEDAGSVEKPMRVLKLILGGVGKTG